MRTHEHGIVKLDRCVFPLVQIEPQRYLVPNKVSLEKETVRNVIRDGRLTIGSNSSAVVQYGQKIGSMEGEVIQLSPEEIEFIGFMHVNWVNRVIGTDETITVLAVSNNTASRNVVMGRREEVLFKNSCLAPVSGSITDPSKFKL